VKKIILALLVLSPTFIFAQGVPGKRMLVKEQLQYTVNATAKNVTRNLNGYVALLNADSIQVNAARATDNYFTVPSPGVDLNAFYNNQQLISVKTTGATVTVNVMVYDFE
jgi:hypothetical protein